MRISAATYIETIMQPADPRNLTPKPLSSPNARSLCAHILIYNKVRLVNMFRVWEVRASSSLGFGGVAGIARFALSNKAMVSHVEAFVLKRAVANFLEIQNLDP